MNLITPKKLKNIKFRGLSKLQNEEFRFFLKICFQNELNATFDTIKAMPENKLEYASHPIIEQHMR